MTTVQNNRKQFKPIREKQVRGSGESWRAVEPAQLADHGTRVGRERGAREEEREGGGGANEIPGM